MIPCAIHVRTEQGSEFLSCVLVPKLTVKNLADPIRQMAGIESHEITDVCVCTPDLDTGHKNIQTLIRHLTKLLVADG